MKTHWNPLLETYDGSQLRSLRSYLEFGLLGDSIYSWKGPCHVSFEHMMDGEDLREKSSIEGSMMLHWIVELFDQDLVAGVFFQRMIADHVRAIVAERTQGRIQLRRSGDDLFLDRKKLSISIATRSPNSSLIHFAVNISNQGTPIATCSLNDFSIDPDSFAIDVMENVSKEWISVREATWKVRSAP